MTISDAARGEYFVNTTTFWQILVQPVMTIFVTDSKKFIYVNFESSQG